MTEKISIAMCTYNGEKYLKEQIDSILKQTYENFELIITDDGSQDKTVELINTYVLNDSRVKLFENELNLGFMKNFEKAISLCTGDYIALSDQDDVWKENKLETLIVELKKNDSFLVYSDALLVDSNLKSLGSTLIEKLNLNQITDDNNLFFIYQNCVSGNTLMFKKELTQKFLPIPPDIIFHDIWIAFVASTIGPLSYVDESLILYRQHDDNVTNLNSKIIKVKKSYNEKICKKISNNKILITKLSVFNTYLQKNFPNEKKSKILKNLYSELSNYNKYYFNYNLFKLFNENKECLFLNKEKIRMQSLIKSCIGIKLYKILPFI
jgi:glycosyltransferase involved in cell wall biosynthesis